MQPEQRSSPETGTDLHNNRDNLKAQLARHREALSRLRADLQELRIEIRADGLKSGHQPEQTPEPGRPTALSSRADWEVLHPLLLRFFDAEWYRHRYPDIVGTDEEVYSHFVKFGASEARNPCGNFDNQFYLASNPDVQDCPVAHYLLYGKNEGRSPKAYSADDFGITIKDVVPGGVVAKRQKKVCCLIHIYYTDMIDELLSYVGNIQSEKDIFINLVSTTWDANAHSALLERAPNSKIIISPDLGRDIGGFSRLFSLVDFDAYDMFVFVHSKKSPHTPESFGARWRKELLEPILGSTEVAERCISHMRDNSHIGLIGARKWRNTEVAKNKDKYNELLDIALLRSGARRCDYISGTMFFLRTQVVKRLHTVVRHLQFEDGHGKELAFHIDGQYAHAVERLIGNLVQDEELCNWFV